MKIALTAVVTALSLVNALSAQQKTSATKPGSQPSTALIQSVKGEDLYRAHCAACHGADARGHGPAAAALRVKPPDLSQIAARNGGKFPEERIAQVIANDQTVVAHGSHEMPVWGPIFHQIEDDQDWGEVRLHNLIQYLESIQMSAKTDSSTRK